MYEWIVFCIGLCFSAFFSGYESAILSLRVSRIRELVKKRVKNAKLVLHFKENQHKTIISLLIGNNIVNISLSALATKMTFDIVAIHRFSIAEAYILAIATGFMTFILLIFGEITPKTFGVKNAEKFALIGAKLFYFFNIILIPLRIIFEWIAGLILKISGISEDTNYYSTGELMEFVDMSHEKGSIKETEKDMIHNILDFNDITVKEIMKPMSDVVAINANISLADALDVLIKDNFSRLPVYEGHMEEIIGVIYIKDVLPYIKRNEHNVTVRQIMRKIIHVPGAKKINTLFYHFKKHKEHIAVVVNEYGNTLGIVTMEDILEELVGEIQDESDDESENQVTKINDHTIIVPGATPIDDINDLLHTKIDNKDGVFETAAGYIFYKIGKIPLKGHKIKIDDMEFTVLEANHKKIIRVKIERDSKK